MPVTIYGGGLEMEVEDHGDVLCVQVLSPKSFVAKHVLTTRDSVEPTAQYLTFERVRLMLDGALRRKEQGLV